MPVQNSPTANLRRRYPLYAEVGLALALGATILAFTLPSPPSEAASFAPVPPDGGIIYEPIPPTVEAPPPTPPAAPPPVEVVNDKEVLEDIVASLDIPHDAYVAPPTGPPAPPVVPAPDAIAPPPLPDPEPIEEQKVFDVVEVGVGDEVTG